MSRRSGISSRQLGALALTAAGLPIFRFCCRVSWVWAMAGGLAAAGTLSVLTALAEQRRTGEPASAAARRLAPWGKVLWWLLLLAGALSAAWESGYAFPETAGSRLAAGLVLILSAAAARKGAAAAGRCAGILLWITGGLYGTVLVFSLPEIRAEWLEPTGSPLDALRAWAALLLPGAALGLRGALEPGARLPRWPWWTAAGLAAFASAVTGGILSPTLARDPEAFRTLARGVSVLGVIRRFEALVNGAMLMSGFALCTLYIVVFLRFFAIYRGPKKSEKKIEKTQKKC